MVALLVDERLGVDLNRTGDDVTKPLRVAILKGHSEVVSMLLAKQGVDVNQAEDNGATPLCIAS